MNIKERNDAILAKMDALRFGHVDHSDEEGKMHKGEKFNPFHFDWNLMVKPPISAYLQRRTVDDLTEVCTNVRIMNDPVKKYKFMEQILAPAGFKICGSGTNRRAFYCEYDPTIILKIGSDRVGRADNISEYHTQNILKPFCSKIYDVLPTGIVALCERLEPLSEKDFKQIWSKEIFDLIMNLLYRGYILEDVGGNFYKNWAVRLGFGPALIDFPYVYEVDWGKLKCSYVDPRTGHRCTGELDYDYSKGMSEIVCDTCGSRYSAAYLRKSQTESYISTLRKGKRHMKPKFSVKLKRGDSVVHSTITEVPFTTVTQPPTSNMVGERVTVVNENVPTTQVRVESGAGRTIEQPVEPQVKATEPPAQANPYKISSAGIGQSHSYNNRPNHYGFGSGSNTAVRTKTVNSNNQQFKRPARPPIREDVMPKVTEFLDHIFKSFGRGTVIDLARRLGVFWIDPKDREEGFKVLPQRNYNQNQEGANNHVKAKEPVSKPEDTTGNATQQQKAESHAESGEVKAAGKDEGASEGKEKKVILPEVEPEKKVVQPEYKAQTEGLFPVKPMSREELDALDMQNREDNVAMGFPGEPLANTMRMSQYFPQLKKRVEDHLNGFSFDDIEDEGKIIDRLHKAISDLTADEIARISGTDTSGIEIMINATLDHMNRTCYAVTIENRKSPVFETIIYPEHKDDEGKVNVEARKIADGINLLENQIPVEVKQEETVDGEVVSSNEEAEAGVGSEEFNDFLKEKVAEYRDEMLQQGEVADQQGFMIQALISELKNAGLQFGVSNRIAKRYVSENFPFNDVSVVNEL